VDIQIQALSDPTRREIVALLRDGPRPVGALTERLSIAQSGVSRHLRILKEAGWVESQRDGQKRLYSLRAEPFQRLSAWLAQYRRVWEDRLDEFEIELERRTAASQKTRKGRIR